MGLLSPVRSPMRAPGFPVTKPNVRIVWTPLPPLTAGVSPSTKQLAPRPFLCMEGGDELIPFVDLGCPPVANALEQAAEAAVAAGSTPSRNLTW